MYEGIWMLRRKKTSKGIESSMGKSLSPEKCGKREKRFDLYSFSKRLKFTGTQMDETQEGEHLAKNMDEVVEPTTGLIQELNLRSQI